MKSFTPALGAGTVSRHPLPMTHNNRAGGQLKGVQVDGEKDGDGMCYNYIEQK